MGVRINQIPSKDTPLIDLNTGNITTAWYQYFYNTTTQPPKAVEIQVSGFKIKYTAPNNGWILLPSGTLSSVFMERGKDRIYLEGATVGAIPLSAGDAIEANYQGNEDFIGLTGSIWFFIT